MCLTVAGEQTAQRAGEVQASLVARECDVLVAVGEAPVAADEARYPDATIVAVDEEIDAPPRRAHAVVHGCVSKVRTGGMDIPTGARGWVWLTRLLEGS